MTAEINQELLALYLIGELTHQQVAERAGVTYVQSSGFYQYYKKVYDFPKPPRLKYPPRVYKNPEANINVQFQEAYSMYQEGLSLKEVGQLYGGVSREYVRQVFNKHGFPSRAAGMTKKLTHCKKGHPLSEKEYASRCPTCRAIRHERRSKGEHFKKTCVHGHAMEGDNVIYYLRSARNGNGIGRRCRICQNIAIRKSVNKKKESKMPYTSKTRQLKKLENNIKNHREALKQYSEGDPRIQFSTRLIEELTAQYNSVLLND